LIIFNLSNKKSWFW